MGDAVSALFNLTRPSASQVNGATAGVVGKQLLSREKA